MGFSGGVIRPPSYLAATAVLAPDSVVGCSMDQSAVVQRPRGAVSNARSTTPSRSITSPAGEFHSPVVRNVRLGTGLQDTVRDSMRALPASWLKRYDLQHVLSTTEL